MVNQVYNYPGKLFFVKGKFYSLQIVNIEPNAEAAKKALRNLSDTFVLLDSIDQPAK